MSAPELPSRVAVLGAGAMGVGAAAVFSAHGLPVTLVVRRPEAVDTAVRTVADRLGQLRALGAIDASTGDNGPVTATLGISGTESYELVFEAVAETVTVKRAALAAAQSSLTEDGLIVTTTSSLPVQALAAGLADPARFAAWHWFYPADLMPLVEIVPSQRTSDATVERLRRWSHKLGKVPIVLNRDAPGFIANRLQYALMREAWALVRDGACAFEDVDLAVTAGLGARWAAIGPFAAMDLAGLDVHAAVCAQLFPALDAGAEVPRALTELRAAGATGAKGGAGILGVYPPERVTAREQLRDRTLIALGPGRHPGRTE